MQVGDRVRLKNGKEGVIVGTGACLDNSGWGSADVSILLDDKTTAYFSTEVMDYYDCESTLEQNYQKNGFDEELYQRYKRGANGEYSAQLITKDGVSLAIVENFEMFANYFQVWTTEKSKQTGNLLPHRPYTDTKFSTRKDAEKYAGSNIDSVVEEYYRGKFDTGLEKTQKKTKDLAEKGSCHTLTGTLDSELGKLRTDKPSKLVRLKYKVLTIFLGIFCK